MGMDNGFIKLNRRLTKWEWYQNANTMRVWIHLLLNANWEDRGFEGTDVNRGELILNYKRFGAELGLTYQEVRTAIEHLKSTGELTARKDGKFVVISIVNYDEYQSNQHDDQHAFNTRSTRVQQSLKKEKKLKNNNKYIYARARGDLENVFLTDDEVERLKEEYPGHYEKLIADVGVYKAKSGTEYASDYAACVSFAINQGIAKVQPDLGYEIETEYEFKMVNGYEVAVPRTVKVFKDGSKEPIS